MNSETAKGLVVYLPSFKGSQTVVISCNAVGLQFLIREFAGYSSRNAPGTAKFVIGKRPPIVSDGRCIITVMVQNHQPMEVVRERAELFSWKMDWEEHAQVIKKLRAMGEYGRPCHQYFESTEIAASSPIVLVSLLEYDDDWLLRIKEDDRSQMMWSSEVEPHQPNH